MKITPLEIRQKTFEKAFRGLDKDEVYAFLATLSQEWEKMLDEQKELRIKLETTQKEVEKLREVENSLFKTLKTAEDTGANMIDQATKAAKLHMRETEIKAEALLNDARTKAKAMLEEAELKTRGSVEEMEDQLRNLAQLYRSIENAREDMITGIKNAATDALEKTERLTSLVKKIDLDDKLLEMRQHSLESSYKVMDASAPEAPKNVTATWLKKDQDDAPPPSIEENNEKKKDEDKPEQNPVNTSFFDDIE